MKARRRKLPDPLDLVNLAGVVAIIVGVWMMNHAAAWIVGGLAVVFYSILTSAGRRHLERRDPEQ